MYGNNYNRSWSPNIGGHNWVHIYLTDCATRKLYSDSARDDIEGEGKMTDSLEHLKSDRTLWLVDMPNIFDPCGLLRAYFL